MSECTTYGHDWIDEITYDWQTGNEKIIIVCAECGRTRT